MGEVSWENEEKSDNIQAVGTGSIEAVATEDEGRGEGHEGVFGAIEDTEIEGRGGEEESVRGGGERRGTTRIKLIIVGR
jgi:hypothetical protein